MITNHQIILKKYFIINSEVSSLLGEVHVDYKNIDFIIKNISYINHELNKNVYLIVIGTGAEEYVNKLKKYAYNLDISDYIIFTGFISDPNKLITSLDLLVAPSLIDAFGRSIVEAMLQKTPVLAAKSGGHVSIINDGINGMFYNPAIEDDFFDILSIIVNGRNMNTLSDEAYQFARDNFSSEQHLSNMLTIYNHLLKS